MTKCRLLIVDDDKVFLNNLEETIVREHKPYAKEKGIALSIEKAYSPEDLKELDGETYDIILSDLCLTTEDEEDQGNSTAIQWLEIIKDTKPIIILLSAHIDDDKIVQRIIKKLTGIRIIPKEPVSLWKVQLFSALGEFKNYMRLINNNIQLQYMDRNFKSFVMNLEEGEDLRMRHMAILFADIRNFTKLCDYFQEKQTIICRKMDEYFIDVEEVIYKCGGIFDKILGDGIMAEFIDGITPHNYLKCALETTEELVCKFTKLKDNLNKKLLGEKADKEGKKIIESLSLGCGIYAGNIYFGKFGNEKRKHFTAMGHEVNMAQRLESAARIDTILNKCGKKIIEGKEVTAIILLPDVVANRLVIKDEMQHYKQIPTISTEEDTSKKENTSNEEDTSKKDDNKKLYIRSYNNNDINRNAYFRIIPEESIDDKQRKEPEKRD